ncbi:hypothetical protein [Helicobacter winghamensis]|uniref:hypothetical protein n=1 Tax=Helicobacter winghamensis TaxID=157268 RepID=UPI0027A993DA
MSNTENTPTKNEFNFMLKKAGLKSKEFCNILGISYSTYKTSWGTKTPIPKYAISYVELYLRITDYNNFIEKLFNFINIRNDIFLKKINIINEDILKRKKGDFTRKDVLTKIKELNLQREEFCKKVDIAYQTITNWDNLCCVPLWVEAWLDIYEKSQKCEKFKILFKDFLMSKKGF